MSYFAYSFDGGDTYIGSYCTEDDAIEGAVLESHEHGCAPFLISLMHNGELRWSTTAEDIVEEIKENLCDDAGEVYNDSVATDEEIKDLEERLSDCITNWIRDNKISSPFELISWTKRYINDPSSGEYIEDESFDEMFQ